MQTDMPSNPRSSLSRTARHSRPAWVQKPMPVVEKPPNEVLGDSHGGDGGDGSASCDSSDGDGDGGGSGGGDGGSGCGFATDVPMSPSAFCHSPAPLFTPKQVSSFPNPNPTLTLTLALPLPLILSALPLSPGLREASCAYP